MMKRFGEKLRTFFARFGHTCDSCGVELFNYPKQRLCADCEKALKESAERFAKRFTKAEALALADGKTVTDLSESEWDEYYKIAKANL